MQAATSVDHYFTFLSAITIKDSFAAALRIWGGDDLRKMGRVREIEKGKVKEG